MTASAETSSSPMPGLYQGRLRPCPARSNCVSSEAGETSWVRPFAYSGPPERAWDRLKKAVQEVGGTIQQDTGQYLWATYASRLFRFVDDVEFRLGTDEAVIHVRSASRVGYYDFGVNRRRVERLRSAFSAQ